MSVIEAVTVVRYRVKDPPEGWTRRRLRARKALAYRDAAWAKIRSRCECEHAEYDEQQRCTFPGSACRFHDREYRATYVGPEDPPALDVPAAWGLPRTSGYNRDEWDYGRAVAFRLARFYAHLDAKVANAAAVMEQARAERAEAALREIRDLLVEKFGIAGTPGTMSHAIIDLARAALAGPSGEGGGER